MARKTAQPPQWQEVDPKAVIGKDADKVWECLYKQSVWTIQRIAETTGEPRETIKEQLDELVKIGKVTYLEKSPYGESAYRVNYEPTDEERKSAAECRNKVGETAGQVWHCLGAAGKTAKECRPQGDPVGRLTGDQIQKRIKAKKDYTGMGIGWLAAEGKLRMFENPAVADGVKKHAFCLTEVEQAIYNGLKK